MSSGECGPGIHFIGDEMHIYIKSIEQVAERRCLVTIQLDLDVVVGHISELSDTDIQGFNFDEEFFCVLFALNGLGRMLCHDYWRFREGTHAPFPWDYGEHNREILLRAERESKTEIASLRV
jgi:hypothetical protein